MTLPCLVGLASTELGAGERELLEELRPAGVLLFRRNVSDLQQLRALSDSVRALLGNVLVAADHEGGAVSVLHAAIGAPPSALALGIAADPALTRGVHAETARRLRAAGVNLFLGPVADVVPAENQVLATRAFGTNASGVRAQLRAALAGMAGEGILTSVKHWPGHGRPRADSHLRLPRNEASLQELMEMELPPFVEAFEAGADSVMVGHLSVPALDPSGRMASCSRVIVHEWLRERLRFEGLVLSDALEMGAFAEDPAACLEAGCDLLLLADPVEASAGALRALADRHQASVRLLEFLSALGPPKGGRESAWDDLVYDRARREGAAVLWPESREIPSWPLQEAFRGSWTLVDAASADRLVRSPVDGDLAVTQAPEDSPLARLIEGALGPPACAPLLLPPPGQGGWADLPALPAPAPSELLFLASLRPFDDAEWERLSAWTRPSVATVVLGDPTPERRLSPERGILLVPGVRPEDVGVALALLRGEIPAPSRGRWGD